MSFVHVSACFPGVDRSLDEHLWLLHACWPDIAGEAASGSSPVTVKRGTLTVEVCDEAFAHCIRKGRREIIKAANSILGAEAILRLRWIQSDRTTTRPPTIQASPPDPETLEIASVIEDEELREKFIRILCLHQKRSSRP
ncbi:MAG TPA: DUF721 domain-containing protein [Thermoanaerobaculia bacterium]|nr:DUF721 domain-containing protein [Thermoanaerobaculia bacterium]HUM30848.1 DUF721 domain-containing protein [Thermoanaerobaculia bacterium]HXK69171.1 DUF721 domain-containing protein [Thermoanaerobaculia bacterium]